MLQGFNNMDTANEMKVTHRLAREYTLLNVWHIFLFGQQSEKSENLLVHIQAT